MLNLPPYYWQAQQRDPASRFALQFNQLLKFLLICCILGWVWLAVNQMVGGGGMALWFTQPCASGPRCVILKDTCTSWCNLYIYLPCWMFQARTFCSTWWILRYCTKRVKVYTHTKLCTILGLLIGLIHISRVYPIISCVLARGNI